MVGNAAVIRESSVIENDASNGTLKSTLTNTFSPEKLKLSTVFITFNRFQATSL